VTISSRLFKVPLQAPLALAASLLAATLMLLVTVAAADGETIDSVTAAAAAPPAAEASAPTEEVPATGEEAETQVDPAPSAPPAPVAEEPSKTKETAPSVTESIDETVESSRPTQHVSKLVDNVRHDSAAQVTAGAEGLPGVRTDPMRGPVDHVARQADRLPGVRTDPVPDDLLDDVARQAQHVVTGALPHVPTDLTAGPLLHSSPLSIQC